MAVQWGEEEEEGDNFIKGSLVVDVIDVKSLKPVWRGICNANIALAPVSEQEKGTRDL